MKNSVLQAIVLLAAMNGCEGLFTDHEGIDGSWEAVYRFEGSPAFRSMSFVDPNSGWVVGPRGAILHTEDGGTSWEQQSSGTEKDLFSVCFCNAGYGWAAGRSNTVLRTLNGGISWEPVEVDVDTGQIFWTVEFIDRNNGWLLSNHGKVYRTENGGETWSVRLTWEPSAGMMHFISRDVGFVRPALGDQMFKTTDGGASWSPRTTKAGMHWERDMFFIDQSQGWLCNDRRVSSVMLDYASVFHTDDGGENWTEVWKSGENGLQKLVFVDENNGWVAGNRIYFTSDGGMSWVCQVDDPSTIFVDLQFVGPSAGYALDFGGLLYRFKAR